MKKGLLVLITAVSFLFYSCGSTKQEAEIPENLEPEVQTEQIDETVSEQESIAAESEEQTLEQEQNESEETQTPVEKTSGEQEDISLLYPPLEEIEDPELIDISPEELEAQALAAAQEAEQQGNQITEPVEVDEELPPLPVTLTDNNAETDEALRQAQGPQDDAQGPQDFAVVPEALEGPQEDETLENLEPTIEVQTEEEAEPEPEILPSRSVSLKKGETLIITYPGSGWIYMGSTSEYNNLASRGRKLGTTDTKYTLLAKEPGTQIHHFYKIDNLTGEYIDDYIEVTVLDKKGSSSTVIEAPEYKEAVPKKPETPAKSSATKQKEAQAAIEQQEKAAEQPQASTTTEEKKSAASNKTEQPVTVEKSDDVVIVVDEDDSLIVVDDEEEEEQIIDLSGLIEEAQDAIKSKKYGDAYTALSKYLEYSTDGRDEALYLMGQILESDSKFRNIKEAVNTYQTLCDNYPASEYWDKANKRIIYLKRFYINIH